MTCSADAVISCRRPDEKTPFSIRLAGAAVIHTWVGGRVYRATERVRPSSANGYEYECTTAGQSKTLRGSKEPTWPTALGATVVDGSVTWTCRALSAATLRRVISAVTYDTPTGVTVTGGDFDVADGRCELSGMISGVTAYMDDEIVAHVVFTDTSHEDIVIQVKGYEAA